MPDDREFLGKEPVKKLLFKLAAPTIVAQLVNMLYNVVDRIYIGHMPENGALALTGIGVCMPMIMAVSAFAALVTSGGAPRASINMGKRDYKTAELILGNCFSLLLIISAVLTAILLVFNRPILLLFGASDNTIPFAVSYMRIYAIGTVFVQLTLGMNMFITAQGFTKISMLTVLIGAVTNIVLDPLFIFVFKMGVSGAALATILSQAISCFWCLRFLCGKKTSLKLRKDCMKLKWHIIFSCISLGFATFIMQMSESILAVCFNSSLLKYGGDIAVGAMTICTSSMQLVFLPLQGVSQGAQPISSYNFGAGNAQRVKETYRLLLTVCLFFSTLLYLAIMIRPQLFATLFTSNAELIHYASTALRIYCGAIFVFGIQISCQMTFTSIGNAPSSILVAVIRKFVLLIPLIYIMPAFNIFPDKALNVYLAEPVADTIAVIFTVLIFTIQFRKALRKLESREKPQPQA